MFHCSIKSVQHSLHPNFCGQLGNTRMWPLTLRSIGRQLRDAPSDWRRSSFAFPGWRRFRILSCHSRPDRRGPNPKHYTPALASSVFSTLRRETLPYGWGDHEQRGPHRQLFHVLHSIRDGLGPLCTPAVLCSRRATFDGPDLTACRFGSSLNQPRVAHSA